MAFPIRRLFVVGVAILYIYLGVCKISPILNKDLHSEFKSSFVGHAKVFPGRFNIDLDANLYRFVFGVAEVVCGMLIIIGESVWAVYAVYILIASQTFISLSLYAQGENTKCIPSLVALCLVTSLTSGVAIHYKLD